jgi:hypothetical protein
MWLFLRAGWANSAAIFALAMVPFLALLSAALDLGSNQARMRTEPVELEQAARPFDSVLWSSAE